MFPLQSTNCSPPALISCNAALFPQCVFIGFVRFLEEQTAVIYIPTRRQPIVPYNGDTLGFL